MFWSIKLRIHKSASSVFDGFGISNMVNVWWTNCLGEAISSFDDRRLPFHLTQLLNCFPLERRSADFAVCLLRFQSYSWFQEAGSIRGVVTERLFRSRLRRCSRVCRSLMCLTWSWLADFSLMGTTRRL
jgi:hypothetical protein